MAVQALNRRQNFTEAIMKKRQMIWLLVVSFLFVTATATMGLAQAQQGPVAKQPRNTISFMGTVVDSKQYGGYMIFRKKPHEEYRVTNVNEAVLSELAKKGEPVQIEGHLVRGAFFLNIDKINGKEYTGGQK
jgi:hypothetical protein